MKNEIFLGFDTSNYTTSIAFCNGDSEVLSNIKCLLPVAEGQKGLRQSDAVFAHIKNLTEITESFRSALSKYTENGYKVVAAAVSKSPRSAEGSYMPCFLVGLAVAKTVCAALNIPLYESSHQHGHIMAALASGCKNAGISPAEMICSEHFALHVSGGTTDFLLVKPSETDIFSVERIGGTLDANAGQIVDRTGVKLGFAFPAGPSVDREALLSEIKPKVKPLSVKGFQFNLSGLENKAEAMMKKGESSADVSAFVLEYISESIAQIIENAFDKYGKLPVIFAGGVMSSEYIRRKLGKIGIFSDAEFSSDNAAGIALIAKELHYRKYLKLLGGDGIES